MHLSAAAIRSQKRASDALALELEGVACCPAWVLGAELGSSNLCPATASKGTAWEILMVVVVGGVTGTLKDPVMESQEKCHVSTYSPSKDRLVAQLLPSQRLSAVRSPL